MKKIQFPPLLFLSYFLCGSIASGADKFEFEYTESTIYSGNAESVIVTAKDNGQVISYTEVYTDASGQTVTPVAAGTYSYSVTFDHPFLKDLSGVFTIQQNTLIVSANPQSRQYGLSNPVLDYQITGFRGSDNSSVISGSPLVSTPATAGSDVGSYGISVDVSGMSSPNYAFAGSGSSLIVTQAPLAIQANSQTRSYGEANPAFTYSASGFRNGDTTAVLGGEPSYNTTATVGSTSGSYPIQISRGFLSATNYSFTFSNGTLTIGKVTQALAGVPAQLTLTFGETYTQLPSTSSAGLPISYTVTPANNTVLNVSGNSLSATGVGSVTVIASQGGNDVYHPAGDAYISITVNRATFDMSAFPSLRDIAFENGKVVGMTDLLAQSTSTPYIFTTAFGANEGIVTDNGDQTLTILAEGSVVLRIAYDDPGGNYDSTPVYRSFDILASATGGGGPVDPGITPPQTPPDPPGQTPDTTLADGIPIGNNWYYLDWFGYFYWDQAAHGNFIYHLEHGWLFVVDLYNNPVWMYSFSGRDGSNQDLGWLFTQSDSIRYPYFAWLKDTSSDTTEYIWYSQQDQDGAQVFWNYDRENFGFMRVK